MQGANILFLANVLKNTNFSVSELFISKVMVVISALAWNFNWQINEQFINRFHYVKLPLLNVLGEFFRYNELLYTAPSRSLSYSWLISDKGSIEFEFVHSKWTDALLDYLTLAGQYTPCFWVKYWFKWVNNLDMQSAIIRHIMLILILEGTV